MSINRRLATVASAAVIAVGSFLSIGAGASVAATSHHHHHHSHCKRHHKYPPGHCKIYFKHHHHHHHHHKTTSVHFKSGGVFKPGETVHITISCPKGYKSSTNTTADHHGHAKGSFTVPSKPHGTCTVKMHGKSSGTRVIGHTHV
jgi:G3E family GTPase